MPKLQGRGERVVSALQSIAVPHPGAVKPTAALHAFLGDKSKILCRS